MKEITINDDENAEVEALQVVITETVDVGAEEIKSKDGYIITGDNIKKVMVEKTHSSAIKDRIVALESQKVSLDAEIASLKAIDSEVDTKLQAIADARAAKNK